MRPAAVAAIALLGLPATGPGPVFAQSSVARSVAPPTAMAGKYERVSVHGSSLAGNLEGDSADRMVSVYLPPSYSRQPKRRYPVLYLLHGFTDSDRNWFGQNGNHFVNVQGAVDRADAKGAHEMIVVMPDAFTSIAQIAGEWAANAPLAMVHQFIPNLRLYDAIAFDAGDSDVGIVDTVRALDQVLKSYAVRHVTEVYPGNHISGINERLETKVIPFFSEHLRGE